MPKKGRKTTPNFPATTLFLWFSNANHYLVSLNSFLNSQEYSTLLSTSFHMNYAAHWAPLGSSSVLLALIMYFWMFLLSHFFLFLYHLTANYCFPGPQTWATTFILLYFFLVDIIISMFSLLSTCWWLPINRYFQAQPFGPFYTKSLTSYLDRLLHENIKFNIRNWAFCF